MSLHTDGKKNPSPVEVIDSLRRLPVHECRLRLAHELERGTFDPEDGPLFHLIVNTMLEHCSVPTVYISDTMAASFSNVERWASGESRPLVLVIRVLYEKFPSVLRGEERALPQYLPDEQALRMLEKMKQLSMADSRRQLTSLINGFAFDPNNKKIFEVLMGVVLRQCRVSAVSIANMLDLTPSTIYRWTGHTNEPLPRTRRRTLHVLPYLLTND